MAFNDLLALIFRGVVIPVFLLMSFMFFKKYKTSSNKYFYGYFVFFLSLLLIQISVFIVDIFSYLGQDIQFDLLSTARFSDWQSDYDAKLGILSNFVRPSYILICVIVDIALASQIYPLEVFLKDTKHIMSRLLVIGLIGISLIFIPYEFFRYSLYTQIVLFYGLGCLLIGFLVNIFINLKLAITTVGEVRIRSIMILIGFILYFLGIIWAARVGWAVAIYSGWGFNEDVILGNIIMIISAILYYRGFKSVK